MDRKEEKATQPKEAKKRKRKRWLKSHSSGFSLSSMSIAWLFAGHFLVQIRNKKHEQQQQSNYKQKQPNSNTTARSNKQEEGTSYSVTHTGTSYHQLYKWQKSQQQQNSKEIATDCNYMNYHIKIYQYSHCFILSLLCFITVSFYISGWIPCLSK